MLPAERKRESKKHKNKQTLDTRGEAPAQTTITTRIRARYSQSMVEMKSLILTRTLINQLLRRRSTRLSCLPKSTNLETSIRSHLMLNRFKRKRLPQWKIVRLQSSVLPLYQLVKSKLALIDINKIICKMQTLIRYRSASTSNWSKQVRVCHSQPGSLSQVSLNRSQKKSRTVLRMWGSSTLSTTAVQSQLVMAIKDLFIPKIATFKITKNTWTIQRIHI